MSKYDDMPFVRREGTENSKPLGTIEVGGLTAEYYIPAQGVPNLYVEGIDEPIIKVEVTFTPGQGWKAPDLVENQKPAFQSIISQMTANGQFQYYVEEVEDYIKHLNQTRPNG